MRVNDLQTKNVIRQFLNSAGDILLLRRLKLCHVDVMPIPVINVAQMREWEAATWAGGQTEAEVIRRVGKKIARYARKLTRADDTILLLAGKGHNGDDVRAAAQHLENRCLDIFNVTAPESDLARLQEFLRKKPALIIDGMFGIGLNRALDEHWIRFITAVNEAKLLVLAVDVPSGLNAETGEGFGAAIEAEMTLTVGAPKTGLLMQKAWPFVGQLEILEDVGLVACPFTTELNWTLPEDFAGFPPCRPNAGHKGTFGHAAIFAGSFGFHGAGVLTTRAAQRAQPGLVTLYTQESVYHVIASQLQAAMVNLWRLELKLPGSITSILIGPGLAAPELPEELKAVVRRWWRDVNLPLVVDASALDWLSAHPLPKNLIRIVTPHPGEAARMLNTTTQRVQADRVTALRDLSQRYGNCWVVLKGHQTLVGRAGGEVYVNPSGNPHLAQGGSGDVLAGFITGLFAQPELQKDVGKTLRYAVWQHGAVADKLQSLRGNWVIEDLPDRLGNVR